MRLVFFYLILLSFQGFIGTLLAPLPAPDFFLLIALSPIRRLKAWQLMLIAYGVGLIQDLIGHGIFGLHAFALAAGIFVALLVREQFSHGFISQLIIIVAALFGKWLAMAAIIYWLNPSFESLLSLRNVLPYEVIFTILAGIVVLPWSESLMQKVLLAKEK